MPNREIMYVRKKKVKNWYYYYLVKSVRQGDKVKQEHIKYLGKTGNIEMEHKYEIVQNDDMYSLWLVDKEGNRQKVESSHFLDEIERKSIEWQQLEFVSKCLDYGYSIGELNDYHEMYRLVEPYMENNYDATRAWATYVNEATYREFNGGIRDGKLDRKEIPYMDKWTKLFFLKKDTTLWRGTDERYYRNLSVGDTFTDKGYCSTTTRREVADVFDKGVVFRINAKKGTKFGLGTISLKEYTLPRNTTFRVTSKKNHPYGFVFMELEII